MSKMGNYNLSEIEKRDEVIRELLEALEEALIDLEDFKEEVVHGDFRDLKSDYYTSDHPTVAKVKAAIKKAKGE